MFIIEDEEMILEESENVGEQTTEEPVEEETASTEEEKPVKMYTEEEFNQKLNEKLDELIPKKLARKEAKIRKEYEENMTPYRDVESVLNAALGTSNISDATEKMRQYYAERGVPVPEARQQPSYSDVDMKVLAGHEAKQIMELGLDEVSEEVTRLMEKGVDKMTPREKLVFTQLAEYKQAEERKSELLGIGAKSEVVNSEAFNEFAKQFTKNTPITKVYELYTKTTGENPQIEKIGSMKNGNPKDEGKLFTPEEVDRLTDKDYENPETMKRVRKSMLSWGK